MKLPSVLHEYRQPLLVNSCIGLIVGLFFLNLGLTTDPTQRFNVEAFMAFVLSFNLFPLVNFIFAIGNYFASQNRRGGVYLILTVLSIVVVRETWVWMAKGIAKN